MRYLRPPRLGEELGLLQARGRTGAWLTALARIDLVILDDLGLVPHEPEPPTPSPPQILRMVAELWGNQGRGWSH